MAGQAFLHSFGAPLVKHNVAPGVVIQLPQGEAPIVTPGRATSKPTPDGGAIVDLNPQPKQEPGSERGGWKQNLATKLDDSILGAIADELLQGIDADLRARTQWEESYKRGLELLGTELKEPTSTPSQGMVTGISTVNNPALLEAVIRAQAGFIGEMLPADGPAKIKIEGEEDDQNRQMAEDFESDFNAYLTRDDKDYYPDTTRGLFHVALYGGVFKKPYWDPLLRRPVSRTVYLWDLIISQDACTIATASRVTHRSKMRTPTIRRLMKQGVWKTQAITPPSGQAAQSVGDKEKQLQGLQAVTERLVDREHTLYECYCDLDLKGYEHMSGGEETGITLPYVVTIEKDSRRVMALRRNWKEDDDNYLPQRPFVLFPFVLGLGFYPLGLLHVLGNTTRTLTAIDREAVDAGMYANFPGGAISDDVARQETNELQSSPGAWKQIKCGGRPINEVLMAWPYRDVTSGLLTLRQKLMEEAQRLGGSALMPVGDGQAEIPVGTMLAMIEQATKPEAAVHKLLHRAQAEELQMLRDLFAEDPEALTRWNVSPARRWRAAAEFRNLDLVPVSDPNVPSHTHRIMQITALVQLYTLFGPAMNAQEVLKRALAVLGLQNIESIIIPSEMIPPEADAGGKSNSPAQDAAAIGKMQAEQLKAQVAQQQAQVKTEDSKRKAATEAVQTQMDQHRLQQEVVQQQDQMQDAAAERDLKMKIAQMQNQTEHVRLQIEESRAEREQMRDQVEAEKTRAMTQMEGQAQRQHEAQQAQFGQQHEAAVAGADRQAGLQETAMGQQHEAGMAQQDRQHEASMGSADRQHDASLASKDRQAQASQTKMKTSSAEKTAKAKSAGKSFGD